jgi:phage terminase Nu1 subunit (DNA packaging protein)
MATKKTESIKAPATTPPMTRTQSLLDTTQLAKLLDISPRWVQKLTNDGVLTRARDANGDELRGRYNLLSIRDYCRWLRSQARLDDTSEQRYLGLRNEKMAAESEMTRLRLLEYKGELHHARDVEFIMNNMLTYFKQRILSIPARVARLCVGKSFREIYDLIMTEIELALRELSGYDRSMFAAQRQSYLEAQGVDLDSLNADQAQAVNRASTGTGDAR